LCIWVTTLQCCRDLSDLELVVMYFAVIDYANLGWARCSLLIWDYPRCQTGDSLRQWQSVCFSNRTPYSFIMASLSSLAFLVFSSNWLALYDNFLLHTCQVSCFVQVLRGHERTGQVVKIVHFVGYSSGCVQWLEGSNSFCLCTFSGHRSFVPICSLLTHAYIGLIIMNCDGSFSDA